ncbi:cation diffusion facilitator family transporter [Pseudodesulfovibrio piezophilus]|uniref:Putative Cation diffusion facilitator family transporter n=1 Tax=Pseudodesulfovibrio piezophilus (strain DSM 21447 / JCM 15486 / C1TLV30) TaxID=1322246 RepID=M1WN61_PSEP2|nr:cation diffusion facilitator family transporter [Pseudodesulfovibrio piezophilus]CCH50185.1 putative Cation diffusion facilitator family transporter [Pseudodesulfovibrio piezophilus C1TLV30]
MNERTVTVEGDNDLVAARKRAALSVLLNMILALVKGGAGILSGSAALIGDAVHSAADVFASGAALVGLWIAGKKHPSFPFGLYKAENIATLVIALAVIMVAYEIGRDALIGGETIPDTALALPVAIGSLIVAVVFGLFQLRCGKKLGSPALIADARDYLVDGASTGVVIIGLIGASFGFALDRWAAGAVSLFVLWAGFELLVDAVRDLLDAAMPRELVHDLSSLVEKQPLVSRVLGCVGRQAGGRYIANLDILLRTNDHLVADRVADRLEVLVKKEFPRIVMVHVRTHFGHSESHRRITPVIDHGGAMAEGLASAPWFMVEDLDGQTKAVTECAFVRNPHRDAPKRRGLMVGQMLMELKPDQVIRPDGHAGTALALLEEAGVDILRIGEEK